MFGLISTPHLSSTEEIIVLAINYDVDTIVTALNLAIMVYTVMERKFSGRGALPPLLSLGLPTIGYYSVHTHLYMRFEHSIGSLHVATGSKHT